MNDKVRLMAVQGPNQEVPWIANWAGGTEAKHQNSGRFRIKKSCPAVEPKKITPDVLSAAAELESELEGLGRPVVWQHYGQIRRDKETWNRGQSKGVIIKDGELWGIRTVSGKADRLVLFIWSNEVPSRKGERPTGRREQWAKPQYFRIVCSTWETALTRLWELPSTLGSWRCDKKTSGARQQI